MPYRDRQGQRKAQEIKARDTPPCTTFDHTHETTPIKTDTNNFTGTTNEAISFYTPRKHHRILGRARHPRGDI